MLSPRHLILLLLVLPLSLQANTWTEKCPQMEVASPYSYKRIWSPDKDWVKKPTPSNQVILMSCGNWKVVGQEMVCYFGGYKTTYDYWVKKDIPQGASCQRSSQCQFKCSAKPTMQKYAPKLQAPMHQIPR